MSRFVAVALLTIACTIPIEGDHDGGARASIDGGDLVPGEIAPSLNQPDAGCRSGFVACGTKCVDLQTDPEHCGTCGNRCLSPDATTPCANLRCGGTMCAALDLTCGGQCTSPATVDNCGACGNRCGDRQLCRWQSGCLNAFALGDTCLNASVVPTDTGLLRLNPPVLGKRAFTCAPPGEFSTRWLRFTVGLTDRTTIDFRDVELASESIALELFDACPVPGMRSLGCATGGKGTKLRPSGGMISGKTYWLAVSKVSSGTAPLSLFYETY